VSRDDLTDFLHSWPHEPGPINARRIVGGDGRAKLQIRIDLGVLQMEMEGRPDGQRFDGFDSLLSYQQDRLRRYGEQTANVSDFALNPEECRALREEAVQYYHRYVGLFALGDYDAAIRDTTRSLQIFDLCRDFAANEADRTALEPFRPHAIMMRARGEAEQALSGGQSKQAMAAIDRGLGQIKAAFEESGAGDAYEQSSEAQLLRGMQDALVPKLPASQRIELQQRLGAALDAENYELAAILRDELRMMEG